MTHDPYGQQQPYGQPGPYGQQPMYGHGYPPAHLPQTNAILALVLSLVGLLTCGVTAIVGVIFGHIALGRIKRCEEGGHGMAVAGVIIGYLAIVGWLLYFAIVVLAVFASQSTY